LLRAIWIIHGKFHWFHTWIPHGTSMGMESLNIIWYPHGYHGFSIEVITLYYTSSSVITDFSKKIPKIMKEIPKCYFSKSYNPIHNSEQYYRWRRRGRNGRLILALTRRYGHRQVCKRTAKRPDQSTHRRHGHPSRDRRRTPSEQNSQHTLYVNNVTKTKCGITKLSCFRFPAVPENCVPNIFIRPSKLWCSFFVCLFYWKKLFASSLLSCRLIIAFGGVLRCFAVRSCFS